MDDTDLLTTVAKKIPDLYDLIAKERGMPENWHGYKFEVKGEGDHSIILVTGAVCTAMYKSGPNKGTRNWSKLDKATIKEIVISKADIYQCRTSWEMRTGLCSYCVDGQAFASWSKAEGNKYRPCTKCDATGLAKTDPCAM